MIHYYWVTLFYLPANFDADLQVFKTCACCCLTFAAAACCHFRMSLLSFVIFKIHLAKNILSFLLTTFYLVMLLMNFLKVRLKLLEWCIKLMRFITTYCVFVFVLSVACSVSGEFVCVCACANDESCVLTLNT